MTAPATPAEVWVAALADGSGRHVPVRKHWPELAAALDAAVDGAVPDTGQAGQDRELLRRAADALRAVGKAALTVKGTLTQPYTAAPETSPWKQFMEKPAREAYNLGVEIRRALAAAPSGAAVAAAQAPESPTDSPPEGGRWGSGEAETATGGRAPDEAALLRRLADLAERWELPLTKRTEAVALAYCTAARDLRRTLTEEAGRG